MRKILIPSIIIIICGGFVTYKYMNRDTFTIINKTTSNINNIGIVNELSENIEMIPVKKMERKKVKLDDVRTNFIYFYNKNNSSKSFEIINKDLNVRYRKVIIDSIDDNNLLNIELK